LQRIRFEAGNIDGAAKQIIHFLEDTANGRDVIYFHGWNGRGASTVLNEVVKRLRSSSGFEHTRAAWGLEKVIHTDFSPCQSKRALQKAIAAELELPQEVMAFFDQYDEEDDFDGVKESARGAISHVTNAIMKELSDCRFLVVLNNWRGRYIDLWDVGVPVIRQLSKRVLWSSRGRFWTHATEEHGEENVEKLAGLSDVAIFADLLYYNSYEAVVDSIRHTLYAEAEEVAKYTGVPGPDMSPKIVVECILYMALIGNNVRNISWEHHASNYWVCDGIIKDEINGGRSKWEIADALCRNVNLDLCVWCAETIREVLIAEQQSCINRWVSFIYENSKEVQVPSQATSFFWTAAGQSINHSGTRTLEAIMSEHLERSSNLRVIHLSHCSFSFSSPPFLSCSDLRFLLLDHCKDKDDAQKYHGEEKECHLHSQCHSQDGGACFQNLWVLDLSYTDWYCLLSKDMLDLMANLRELNVKGVSNRSMSHLHHCSGAGSNSRRLLKLRVVAEPNNEDENNGVDGGKNQEVSPVVASFPDLSSWHILKTIVLDGCGDLEQVGCNALPLSLESFSLISNVPSKVKKISFQGHTKLKILVLRGLFDILVELDMSGTTIKTLDLSEVQAKSLRRLFLLGCEKLNAIRWQWKEEDEMMWLEALCIDTTTQAASTWNREDNKSYKQEEATRREDASETMHGNGRAVTSGSNYYYVSLSDPRLFRSLVHHRHDKGLHVEISSTGGRRGSSSQGISNGACSSSGGKKQVRAANLHKSAASNLYADAMVSIFNSKMSQAGGADRDEASVSMSILHCPPAPRYPPDLGHCYISIQDETQTKQETRGTTLPSFVHKDAKTLHLHDSLSITSLPGPAPAAESLVWNKLQWCRLERCPNIEGAVFTAPSSIRADGYDTYFSSLQTLWASQLLMARYIWDLSTPYLGAFSFARLKLLHIDSCPRLAHVLPLYTSIKFGCHYLETLEIVCCGELREIFASSSDMEPHHQEPRSFPRLKRIYLYDLPMLQHICGRHSRMYAPKLKTVKIRGCWSLKRLPAVRRALRGSTPPLPTVECEKDWWDSLQWDGEEAGHHPSHYKPTHSAYYKKALLRTSVLR